MAMDSIDKIVSSYFAAITKTSFTYAGKVYESKPLRVSPLLLRGFTCPVMCGGCCYNVTLDYLPEEAMPGDLVQRRIEFNDSERIIYSDKQSTNEGKHCRHLTTEGRCGIYQLRPFPCDFELIRFLQGQERNSLLQKLHGRGWRMQRVDGERGSLCKMTPVDPGTVAEVQRKFHRLKQWTDYFSLDTWIPEIQEWILTYPEQPLLLGIPHDEGFLAPATV